MKKVFFAALAASLSCFAINAQVVDEIIIEDGEEITVVKEESPKEKKEARYGFLNHVGIGASAGLMDVVSAQVALPLGSHFQVRGGYSFASSVVKLDGKRVGDYYSDIDPVEINGTKEDLRDCKVSAALQNSWFGMLDIYPSGKRAFHFTVGAFGPAGGNLLTAALDLTNINSLAPSDYGTLEFSLGSDTGDQLAVTTDFDGKVQMGIEYKNGITPYFGLGWGRGANLKHRVSLSFDLGVMYVGGMKVYANNYFDSADRDHQVVKKQYLTSSIVNHDDHFDASDIPVVGSNIGEVTDIIDKVAAGEMPYKIGSWLPVMKLGINIRLF